MKQTRILLLTAVCGAVLAMTSVVSAQTEKSGIATIVRIQGEGRYSMGDGNWHTLVAGRTLGPGAIIQTGHNAIIDVALGNQIQFPQARSVPDKVTPAADSPVRGMISYRPAVEQNMVRLTPDTTLQIDKLTVSETGLDAVSDTELNLKQGHIFANVKKLSGASQYLIKIPNGIAGVRGTFLSVDADGTVAVYQSDENSDVVLSIIKADGSAVTYTVSVGSQFNPSNGATGPIPSGLLFLLKSLVPILKTQFVNPTGVALQIDQTTIFVSPTTGAGVSSTDNNTPSEPPPVGEFSSGASDTSISAPISPL